MLRWMIAAAAMAVPLSAVAESQLERSLRVAPGAYSIAELVELQAARSKDDRQRVRFLLAHRPQSASPGLRERAVIAEALDEHNWNRVRFVENGGLTRQAGSREIHATRLASAHGVRPDSLSFAELLDLDD